MRIEIYLITFQKYTNKDNGNYLLHRIFKGQIREMLIIAYLINTRLSIGKRVKNYMFNGTSISGVKSDDD